jgi:gamma-glutamylaminecyclotransferase
MVQVFIYGTLKRGFPLFDKGLAGETFLGLVQTKHPYPLFIAADFYGPMMLDRPGEGLVVSGELFEVRDEQLPILDQLEDVGEEGSFRTSLLVEPVGGGASLEAIGFMKTEAWLEPLHSGPLGEYQDRRFIPPWER